MRLTLHAVSADDYPAFQQAMLANLRASRLGDQRFTVSGLSIADADTLLPELLGTLDRPRTSRDIEDWLAARFGQRRQGIWWALRTFAPVHHAPTGKPWSFGPRAAYVAAGTQLAPDRVDESVRWLVRRYLEAFGPATVADIAQFSLLQRSVARAAVNALMGELVAMEGPDGSELFDVAGGLMPKEGIAAPPRLLPMWDSILLAYADRSRVIPSEYRRLIIRQNGDVLPTLLIDGYVAGVWRPVEGGIEATTFQLLADEAWRGLAGEAAALVAFLADRDPSVYRRYRHWWSVLPSAEVRLLPA